MNVIVHPVPRRRIPLSSRCVLDCHLYRSREIWRKKENRNYSHEASRKGQRISDLAKVRRLCEPVYFTICIADAWMIKASEQEQEREK